MRRDLDDNFTLGEPLPDDGLPRQAFRSHEAMESHERHVQKLKQQEVAGNQASLWPRPSSSASAMDQPFGTVEDSDEHPTAQS